MPDTAQAHLPAYTRASFNCTARSTLADGHLLNKEFRIHANHRIIYNSLPVFPSLFGHSMFIICHCISLWEETAIALPLEGLLLHSTVSGFRIAYSQSRWLVEQIFASQSVLSPLSKISCLNWDGRAQTEKPLTLRLFAIFSFSVSQKATFCPHDVPMTFAKSLSLVSVVRVPWSRTCIPYSFSCTFTSVHTFQLGNPILIFASVPKSESGTQQDIHV